MQRRRLLAAAASAVLARPALAQPIIGGTLRFVPEHDLPSPDPHFSDSRVTRDHALLVFDTLFGRDRDNQPRVQMLDSYLVEREGLQWRLQLRDGVYFHTLERVLARDCVDSIRRWAARDPYGQALMAQTDELVAEDDRTIRFRLKSPFPMLPAVLGKNTPTICAILPSRLAVTDPATPITEIVGSGPFTYAAAEREPGKRVVYLRHAPYVPARAFTSRTAGAKDAFFQRVEWQVLSDPEAAEALVKGTADWWGTVAPAQLAALRSAPGVALKLIASAGRIATLRPNHLHSPFNAPAARRALLAAISQHDCMVALNGADGPEWRDGVGFFSPDSKIPLQPVVAPLRPDAARRALQAAGYNDGLVRLLVPARLAPLGNAIAALLRGLGLNLDAQTLAPDALGPRLADRNPPDQGGWSLALGETEADAMADPVGNVLLRGNAAAPGWPNLPRLETMRQAWLEAPDPAWQQRIATEMQVQAMQDVPYIPLGISFPPSALRANITGMEPGLPLFWGVSRK